MLCLSNAKFLLSLSPVFPAAAKNKGAETVICLISLLFACQVKNLVPNCSDGFSGVLVREIYLSEDKPFVTRITS